MKKNDLSIGRKIVCGSNFSLLPLILLVLLSFKSKDENALNSASFATNIQQANVLLSGTSGNWIDQTCWSKGVLPTENEHVIIDHDNAYLEWDMVINNLTINPEKKLTIKYSNESPTQGGSLTVNAVTNNGTLVLEGSGTLVVNGSTFGTGIARFKRDFSNTNWRLLASPLKNVRLDTLISNNSFTEGTGSNIGIAFYDNTQPSINERWVYQTNASKDTLSNGKAFASKLDIASITIQGDLPNYEVDTIQSIQMGINGSGYNLIGNPFTSYIPANENADQMNNILTLNSDVLSEQTIWFWLSDQGAYFPFNHAIQRYYIGAMQGFFVHIRQDLNSADFVVPKSYQTASFNDNFVKETLTSRPEIKLNITNQNKQTRMASIFYVEGTTKGSDNGYDSTVFSAGDTSFLIYTHLVEDNNKHYAIQSLPSNDYESMIVPVGIHTPANSTLKITAEIYDFPEDISVYLQDVVTNTFVNLSERKEPYVIQITDALEGKGRFYIHTTQKDPSQLPYDASLVTVFSSGVNSLDVLGLLQEQVAMQLYDIRGTQVFATTFKATGNDRLSLPTLAKGVYVVSIETSKGRINKKVVM